jgi:hypothetical protein
MSLDDSEKMKEKIRWNDPVCSRVIDEENVKPFRGSNQKVVYGLNIKLYEDYQ